MTLAKIVLTLTTLMVLAACNSGFQTVQGAQGPAGPQGPAGSPGATGPQGPAATPAPTTAPDTIADIVAEYNATRLAQGQDAVSNGLNCALYTVPTSTTAIIGASLTGIGNFKYVGTFNQPNASVSVGLDILPKALSNVYQTWFIVKCYGELVVTDNNWHQFDLSSDDGSNLYIDGSLLNNDGLHAVQTKSAAKFLASGVHSFELDFFQAAGMQALILNMDGKALPAANLYH